MSPWAALTFPVTRWNTLTCRGLNANLCTSQSTFPILSWGFIFNIYIYNTLITLHLERLCLFLWGFLIFWLIWLFFLICFLIDLWAVKCQNRVDKNLNLPLHPKLCHQIVCHFALMLEKSKQIVTLEKLKINQKFYHFAWKMT